MTAKKKKRKIAIAVVTAILLVLIIWTAWSNTALELNRYTIKSDKLSEVFNGFRIAHVSDLHNSKMGTDNEKLIDMIKSAAPDIIAITGDSIDSNHTDVDIALCFIKEAIKIAPCYYITGNHEAWVSESTYNDFESDLIELGVVVLHNEEIVFERESAKISIVGIDDPDFIKSNGGNIENSMTSDSIKELVSTNGFSILLSHRPEFFNQYVRADFDLVLSGHAHGGQFRLPFIGGLAAPNQGLFPEYDSGLYTEDNTNMIVSRGIGNSIIPFRFNNRPEVVLIEFVVETVE